MKEQALSDLKVIEFGDFISAPFCGKLLAAMGAEVIKIEAPVSGDESRQRGPFPGDVPHPERSGLFLYMNTNKLGITLDPEVVDPEDVELLEDLIVAAVTNARDKAREMMEREMGKLMPGGLGLPGLG